MRIYVGGLIHETNAFSPVPTRLADYGDHCGSYEDLCAAAAASGVEMYRGRCARAAPSAPTVRADYETLRNSLVSEIVAQGPFDCILLSLHGAQVAEGYPDCEGDVVAAVRGACGNDVTIGVMLDLHAAIGLRLLEQANLVCVIKEYPHTDFPETAAQLVDLALRQRRGQISPVTAFVPIPVFSLWHTPLPPSKTLVDDARALESESSVLHISLVHGFPWSDVADAGAAVLVITDGDPEGAVRHARQFAHRLWKIRDADLGHYQSIEECLDQVPLSHSGPLVIADAGDNPGAGTGSDATWILHEVVARGLQNVALALFHDPEALARVVEGGVGATVRLSLGGHSTELAGAPLVGDFTVTCINPTARIDAMPGYEPIAVGTLAAVRYGGVQIVLGDYREQVFGPRVFREVGIDPLTTSVLVVKSAQHFYNAFASFASTILYCDSPCSRTVDFARLPFSNRRSPMWPLEECGIGDIPAPVLIGVR
jgi:microcystin degradation protein MlrC|tara:strand:+ start:42236 stop:43684 length:1449 start_codon:yes stop_codon:yes gene_type:complete